MNCQMIRVISSPSSSTTGLATLIFAILKVLMLQRDRDSAAYIRADCTQQFGTKRRDYAGPEWLRKLVKGNVVSLGAHHTGVLPLLEARGQGVNSLGIVVFS